MDRTGILIAGAGIAGLTAAARLGVTGREITVIDPALPASGDASDLRTTAFLQPAIATLTAAGVWSGLEHDAAPLRIMRIIDAGGAERVVRETADFLGSEVGHELFGWNVANRAIRAALLERLESMPNVQLCHGVSVTGYVSRLDRAVVRLSDGRQIAAELVLAADGRYSALRRLAGISARRWDYGQQALVFVVTHPNPHDGVSTEIHRTGGPLTLVPMPDHEGAPCSSVVWMVPGPRARDLAALDDTALAAELTAETMCLYGRLEIAGPRGAWPIISQVAQRLTAPRLALIAEAAHVMPPIGAQGLNTSLHDIETIAALTNDAEDPGAPELLSRYAFRILPRMMARVGGVDLLNRAAQAEAQPLRDLRLIGLRAIQRIAPLRRLAIRSGLGV